MTLEEKLQTVREQGAARMPPEVRAIMRKGVEDLRASGITQGIAKVGAAAPEFTLPNAAGQSVSLATLRARGPVVLSFYRGRW